ncbi:unnamed protein product [Prorocentrum cordatum]|uniref:Tyrosine specific protein phosphatases domain-containing protein n=1 Tax=Prorocentrum cordatum TaxID=2364126 RepID=A0ABN9XU97_9DINO|nr:unnamed protein product [Polarella glacialis]
MIADSMSSSTLIPQRLCYGPTGSATSDKAVLTLKDVTAPGFREGCYGVCHYPAEALGGCVGPLAFDQMLWFGLELDTRLKDPSKFVAVQYEAEERQNVAVLTGAYLVLGQGWSANEVCIALPEDAALTLPCSWIDPGDLKTSHPRTPSMVVQDCWEGVQMARDLGWLSKDSVQDGVMTSLAASKFWKTTYQYDGAWLVPGDVFVMADPMTTIKDPDPVTCAAFCRERCADPAPEEDSLDEIRGISKCTASSRAQLPASASLPEEGAACWSDVGISGAVGEEAKPGASSEPLGHLGAGDQLAGMSTHTVCKAYRPGAGGGRGHGEWPEAKPFVDFLLEEGIRAVVRVNKPDERGLAEIGGSYDAGLLTSFGIRHANVFVSDATSDGAGAVPPDLAVRRFLSFARDTNMNPDGGSAILVHCKGGFGRSVFLACILVIHKYSVSGRGLLGWARIARPGAITTPEQEAVLRSLSGRADLSRRYGVSCEGECSMSRTPACCTVS